MRMVQLAGTRQVRGGTEQYYQRAARMFDFVGEGARANYAVSLQAVGAELVTADDEPMLTLRNIRLTRQQAADLSDQLERIADG